MCGMYIGDLSSSHYLVKYKVKKTKPRALHSLELTKTASTSEDSLPEPDERHV